MRLQEIYSLCKNALHAIEYWNDNIIRNNKKEIFGEEFIDEMNRIYTPLLQVEGLSDVVKQYLNSNDENYKLSKNNQIIEHLIMIVTMLDSMNLNPDSNGFDVKLPPNMTMSEFSKCIKDIDTAFSQCPTLNLDGDKIDFAATDVGSSWLTFIVSAVAGVSLLDRIADFVDKCVQIRTNIATCNILINHAKTSGVATDMMTTIIESHRAITDALTTKFAKDMCEGINTNEQEDVERTKLSLSLISAWMDKGLEIYASVNAPIETKELFPAKEKQRISDNVLGKLSENILDTDTVVAEK